MVTSAPVDASSANGPLDPVVERCTSNPSSLLEWSRHERLIWLEEAAAAVNPLGMLGAVVSAAACVVAEACPLWPEVLPATSYAPTV